MLIFVIYLEIQTYSNVTIGSRYLLSLYFVANAITFTGLSDITARTSAEISIAVAFIFSTVFVIGYLLGEMTQSLTSQVCRKMHYQHVLSVIEVRKKKFIFIQKSMQNM